jgi:hypothetical protein
MAFVDEDGVEIDAWREGRSRGRSDFAGTNHYGQTRQGGGLKEFTPAGHAAPFAERRNDSTATRARGGFISLGDL